MEQNPNQPLNIERYEAAHGAIGDMEQIEIPMNFGGPTAQA